MLLWTRRGFLASSSAWRAGSSRSVILTDETGWIGGQATTQGVPLDEHPYIEERGRTKTCAAFRARVPGWHFGEARSRRP